MKTVLRGKSMALNAYIKKEERSKISNLSSHFRKLKMKSKLNPKQAEEKILKIQAEINETEKRKSIQKINKTKSCFFEIDKIDKPLARLRKNRVDTSY